MAPDRKITKACKAMKELGYSAETVKPVLKNILDVFNQNWQFIEDENYAVLVDAILESEERKGEGKKKKKFCLVDETVEDEPPTKRHRLRSHTIENSYSPRSSPLPNESTDKPLCDVEEAVFGVCGKKKMKESAHSCIADDRMIAKVLSPIKDHPREEKTSSPNYASGVELTEKIQLTSDDRSDESESLSPQTLDDNEDPCNTCSILPVNIITNQRGTSCVSWEEKNFIHDDDLSNQKNMHINCHYDATGETGLLSVELSELHVPLSIIPPDDRMEAKVLSLVKDHQREEKTRSPNYASGLELTEKIQLTSEDRSDESKPLSPQTLDDIEDACNTCSIVPVSIITNERGTSSVSWEENNVIHNDDLSNQKNAHSNCHYDNTGETELLSVGLSELEVPLSIIPPVSVSYEKDPSSGNCSSPEGPNMQSECLAEGEDSCSDSSHIDIASSSEGEVKISMTFKFSRGSISSVPSLGAVLRQMEEHCLESYRITTPGFSIMNMMNNVFEEFSAAGATAMAKDRVRTENGQLARVTFKILDPAHVLNRSLNHHHGFCIAPNLSSAALQVHNLIEVVPWFPKFQGLNHLDLTGCHANLTMSGAFGETILKIKGTGGVKPSSSSNKMIIQKQHFSNDMLDSTYYVEDITRGEDVKVSLINEVNNEHPPCFKYIPTNMTYQNAYVKFLLARISDGNCCSDCFGDCLSSQIPCACAAETGGEFAYMPGGLLKESFLEDCISINRSPQEKNLLYCKDCPLERSKARLLSGKCKGHLFRKFIKECWFKCGCRKKCGNRVIQKGIAAGLQVFMTPEGKGWGLRTLKNLPKGAFVCEYVGEIVTNMELFERNMGNTEEKHTYPVLLDADWCTEGVLKDEEALCLDATFFGNVARFINHRCYDANLVEIPVEVETPDHHYYHLAFFTTREINALEELTWDYGIDFDDHTHPVKAFQCHCGSQFCRDMKPVKS